MAKFKIEWDELDKRLYETGVDRGTLYPYNTEKDSGGKDKGYDKAVAWSGLTAFTESPEGAEATDLYADNIKYLSMLSAENLKGTLEAYTYPDEFMACDGSASLETGVFIGQQERKTFGFSYRTKVGTAVNPDAGYKIHIIYGAKASPSEKAYNTINDNPDAIKFSWSISTTPVTVDETHKPTASVTIDCTLLTAAQIEAIETVLYGTSSTEGRLPLPSEIASIISGAKG